MTLLGFANPFSPLMNVLVGATHVVIETVNGFIGNYGWTLVIIAALVTVALWPLKAMQIKSMGKMQQLQPKIKALQKKYPGKDSETVQKLNSEMMALYKSEGANPVAGCVPALIPLPIVIAIFYAIQQEQAKFASATWLWIGSPISEQFSRFLATSLAKPDHLLLAIYVVAMYFSVRYASPAATPEQEQQQKIMAFISPAMIGYFGFQYHWPAGLLIYWIAFLLFGLAQQIYMMRRYAAPKAAVAGAPAALAVEPAASTPADDGPARKASNGQTSRKKRRSRR